MPDMVYTFPVMYSLTYITPDTQGRKGCRREGIQVDIYRGPIEIKPGPSSAAQS